MDYLATFDARDLVEVCMKRQIEIVH